MDDRPVSGGGAYNINWDEIDELSNPFGDKGFSKSMPRSPIKPLPQGDGPASPKKIENVSEINETNPTPVKSPNKGKSKGQSIPKDTIIDKNAASQPLKSPAHRPDLINGFEKSPNANSSSNQIHNPNSSHSVDDVIPYANKSLVPSPEEISKALENAALLSDPIAPESEPTGQYMNKDQVLSDPDGDSNIDLNQNSQPESMILESHPPTFQRIDSSTRPASPAQPGFIKNSDSSTMNGASSPPISSQINLKSQNSMNDTESKDSELIALRKERDHLNTVIEEMKHCIAEYARSLQHIIEEKAQNQTQVNVSVADLISERDQAVEELATIEKAFGDLHRRFEKSKQVIEGFKQNEEALKRSIEEYKNLLQRQEQKYLALKKHAEEQLSKVNQDTELIRQEFETNQTRLQAALRIAELRVENLESQLEQKTKQNEELTKICDELLNKYGGMT